MKLTDPGAALFSPPILPADASILFNLSILSVDRVIDLRALLEELRDASVVFYLSSSLPQVCCLF